MNKETIACFFFEAQQHAVAILEDQGRVSWERIAASDLATYCEWIYHVLKLDYLDDWQGFLEHEQQEVSVHRARYLQDMPYADTLLCRYDMQLLLLAIALDMADEIATPQNSVM